MPRQLSHKPGANPRIATPDHIVTRQVTDETTLLPFLCENYAPVKRTGAKAWLKYGQVKANGQIVTAFDLPLAPGDTVQVNTSRPWQTLSHPRLKLIYEDDDILVVEKGYGLLSVATDRRRDLTAYTILRDYLKRVDPTQKLFIVHRLDQHTSGLMLFAKNPQAKDTLQHNWNNMVLDRRYAAIVEGAPEPREGTVDTLLCENINHLMYVPKDDDPRIKDAVRAVTRYKTLKTRGAYSLLDVSLDTGRKNQIRAHLAHLGYPIAGDRKYGAKSSPIHRLCLHARTLRFIHPVTRRDMNFNSPLPSGFVRLV